MVKVQFHNLILSKWAELESELISENFFFLSLLAPGMDIVIIWRFLKCWAACLAKGNNCLHQKKCGEIYSRWRFCRFKFAQVHGLLHDWFDLVWILSCLQVCCFSSKPSGLFSYSWVVRLWQTRGFSLLHPKYNDVVQATQTTGFSVASNSVSFGQSLFLYIVYIILSSLSLNWGWFRRNG